MKLLFVIDTLSSGGSQRQMVSLAIGLKRLGHAIEFLIYHPELTFFAPLLESEDILIHRIYKKHKYSIKVIIAIRQLVNTNQYDGVLSFLTSPNLYSELALLGKKRPFLVVSERNFLPQDTYKIVKWGINQFHLLADHITVNAHHQKNNIQQNHHKFNGHISTIYNGVDLSFFSPQPFYKNKPSNEVQQLLVLSSIVPRKNMVNLIKALAVYRKRHNQIPFKINWAGKRNPSVHAEQAFTNANMLIQELKLEAHWQWLGEKSNVVKLLNTHDALIHPGVREGLPNGICEALACGCPVLAGNILDHPKLIKQGIRGFLFDPYEPDDIAEKLHQFYLLSRDERKRMGVAARSYAEKYLSLEKMTQEYESLFLNLINSFTD